MDKYNIFNHSLYCIVTEKYCNGRTSVETTEELIKAGVKIIQYREKDKSLSDKYEDCIKIRELTRDAGVTFIVNDDVKIAIDVKADGIHIGQGDMPVETVRSLCENNMLIGLSTHTPAQALEAVKMGVDYIGVGPIFPTATKEDVCKAVGLEYLDFVAKNINIPFVAIGGIKCHNLENVANHGAKCFALVTEIISAEDIGERIDKLYRIIKKISPESRL